ncbi:MAG: efflux RND transporter permease subunit, partial [Alphaproteobacteria bacterium]|nr:efflux RND transporter permease subunit [Alphaproteobacteria bacterium]
DNMAGMWVELAPSDMREVRNPEIIAAWKQEIRSLPGLERVTVTEMVGGPPGEPIDIRLYGADISTLKQASLEVQELLERFAGLRDIDDDLPYGKQELIVELTPRGTAMGFTTESVSRQIRNASEGAIAKRFPRGDEEVLVRVQYPEGQFNAETLRELYLRNPEGVEVPLMEVVNLRESQGFSRIRRQDGITEVAVTANLNTEVTNTNRVLNALPAQGLDEIARKYSIDYTFRGKAEEQARSFGEVGTGFLIAMAAIYIILAWVLGSYALPVVVMTIIPFGLVGAVLGHLVLGYDMSIMSIIGLLGLSGILVNDSIILVSTIQERVSHGEKWDDAIIEGTRDRFRAVMLTSLTTIGGLMPLLFETSLQAQFLMPIAITLVFGIAMATLIVLIVVPSLMGVVRDVRAFHISLRRGTAFGSTRRRRSRPGSAAPETGAE